MDPTIATPEAAAAAADWVKIAGVVAMTAMGLTQIMPSVTNFKAYNFFMWIVNRLAGNNFAARNADEPKKS